MLAVVHRAGEAQTVVAAGTKLRINVAHARISEPCAWNGPEDFRDVVIIGLGISFGFLPATGMGFFI
jgi:hypothetical protein